MNVFNTDLISSDDFKRIHVIIKSILVAVGNDPASGCVYFSNLGVRILREHFDYDARVVAGLAAYEIGLNNKVAFGREASAGHIKSDKESFHAWIEIEDTAIDFMAPCFPLTFGLSQRPDLTYLFQRKLSEQKSCIDDLVEYGDFYFVPNFEITKHVMDNFWVEGSDHVRLSEWASHWFVRYPYLLGSPFVYRKRSGEEYIIPLLTN